MVLDVHQRQYAVIEKECFALVWAVQQLRRYLYGTRFIVQTDHRPLQWLMSKAQPPPKLLRWALILQEYDFVIVYGQGKDNVLADALSRLESNQPLSANLFRELEDLPSACTALPIQKTKILTDIIVDRTEEAKWIGRMVEVPGYWWGCTYARRNNIYNAKFRMTIRSFTPGDTPTADRWTVVLPVSDPSNPTGEEVYEMNREAIHTYLCQREQPQISDADDPTAEPTVTPQSPEQIAADPVTKIDNLQSITTFDNPAVPQLDDPFFAEHRRLELPLSRIAEAQRTDETSRTLIDTLENPSTERPAPPNMTLDENGILHRLTVQATSTRKISCQQILVPLTLVETILYLHHGHAAVGHLGMMRTYIQLQRHFFCKNMRADLCKWILGCHCQGIKRSHLITITHPPRRILA
jgi:hypothetical protein